jgi:DNA repair protein RadC
MKSIVEYQVKQKRIPVAQEEAQTYTTQITTHHLAYHVAEALFQDEAQEVFAALYLNTRNTLQGYSIMARGGQAECKVDPRVLFRNAILAGAESVILVHNHPSGNPEPSPEDLALTKRIVAAGELIGVRVLDHLIVGETVTSLAALHLM